MADLGLIEVCSGFEIRVTHAGGGMKTLYLGVPVVYSLWVNVWYMCCTVMVQVRGVGDEHAAKGQLRVGYGWCLRRIYGSLSRPWML